MALTDTHVRNAKPKPTAIPRSATVAACTFSSCRMARTIGGWTIASLESAARSLWVCTLFCRFRMHAHVEKKRGGPSLTDIDPGVAKKARKRAARIACENTFEAIAREWIANQRHRLASRYCALLLARLEADIFRFRRISPCCRR